VSAPYDRVNLVRSRRVGPITARSITGIYFWTSTETYRVRHFSHLRSGRRGGEIKFSLAQLGFFVVFFGSIPLAQSSSAVATVSGRVLTEDGHPVSDASVYLASLNGVAVGRPATVTTDKAGVFKISVKEPGTYAIHALKPEAGYADVIFAFDLAPGRVLKQQPINISTGQNLTGVNVTLGPNRHQRGSDDIPEPESVVLRQRHLCATEFHAWRNHRHVDGKRRRLGELCVEHHGRNLQGCSSTHDIRAERNFGSDSKHQLQHVRQRRNGTVAVYASRALASGWVCGQEPPPLIL
jgi:Carboxypeptidase regulatory-like domain